MKTSKSSVFIAGIDDVEKVISYLHPPVKQMEHQVEVPVLAVIRLLRIILERPKRDTGRK